MIFSILVSVFIPMVSYGTSKVFEMKETEIPTNTLANNYKKIIGEPISSTKRVTSLFLAVIIIGFINFIPTVICLIRKHTYKKYIIFLNVFLGWTLIGWVICLIWSFADKKK